jgi:hypothetical protein
VNGEIVQEDEISEMTFDIDCQLADLGRHITASPSSSTSDSASFSSRRCAASSPPTTSTLLSGDPARITRERPYNPTS